MDEREDDRRNDRQLEPGFSTIAEYRLAVGRMGVSVSLASRE